MDAALGLGLHETFRRRDVRLLSASCALNVCPVTIGNCHHFYDKTSSTGALQFNKFGYNLSLYGEMAAITYMKTELNYSKYIFHDSISHNLQPIRKNESNIKYYWIIFTMSLFFYANNSTTENRKPFLLWFLWYSLSVIVSPALTQFSETLQQRNFYNWSYT